MVLAMIFPGNDLLAAAQRRVGWIVDNCAKLEHAVAYLEWQLIAFRHAADHPDLNAGDLQIYLHRERQRLDKYAKLESRLSNATQALAAPPVQARLTDLSIEETTRRAWADLDRRAREVGKRRNEIAHSFIGINAGNVIREIGRPWNEQHVVSAADDDRLISLIGELYMEIGVFTTDLGYKLPFADQNQIITGIASF